MDKTGGAAFDLYGMGAFKAALTTYKAPWWKVRLAQIFGTRVETWDDEHRMVCHYWRGTYYMTQFRKREKEDA